MGRVEERLVDELRRGYRAAHAAVLDARLAEANEASAAAGAAGAPAAKAAAATAAAGLLPPSTRVA